MGLLRARTASQSLPLSPEELKARELGVTRFTSIGGFDIDVPTVAAIRPRSKTVPVLVASGLRRSEARTKVARAAIAAAAAERPLQVVLGTHRELRRDYRIPDLETLGVTERFSERGVYGWVRTSEARGEVVWVPAECVASDATIPGLPGRGAFSADAGLGTGATFERACSAAVDAALAARARSRFALLSHETLESRRVAMEGAVVDHIRSRGMVPLAWQLEGVVIAAILGGGFAGMGSSAEPEDPLTGALLAAAADRALYFSGGNGAFDVLRYDQTLQTQLHAELAKLPIETKNGPPHSVDEKPKALFVDLSLSELSFLKVVRAILPLGVG